MNDVAFDADAPDVTDDALQIARSNATAAVIFLLSVMNNNDAPTDARVRAAESILGVAGCLSL